MSIPFGTFCTGIGAPEVAARGLGFHPVFVSEIEPFPCAVLAHRFGAGRPINMPSPDEAGLEAESILARRAAIKSLGKIKWGDAVPNYGDFTKIDDEALQAIRVLVAGTPCQAFSVAGLRNSLDDARGNLTLEFVKKVHAAKSLFCAAWENVPGVLSTKDNAFGCFLAALVGADDALRSPLERGRWPDSGMVSGPRGRAAWIIKDAQYFGVPQRRRRVFLIFCPSASGGDPAAILFERQSEQWDTEASDGEGQRPSRNAGGGFEVSVSSEISPTLRAQSQHPHRADSADSAAVIATFDRQSSGEYGTAPVASTVSARDYKSASDLIVSLSQYGDISGTLTATHDGSPCADRGPNIVAQAFRTSGNNGAWDTGDRVDAITTFTDPNSHVIAFGSKDHGGDAGFDISPTLRASNSVTSHPNAGAPPAIAFALRGREGGAQPEIEGDMVGALRSAAGGSSRSYVVNYGVRRLTTVECARLQGFPDDHTQIPFGTAKKLIAEELAYLRLTQPALTIDEARLLAADGPQYKAYGNSMAVPVIRWLWIRIREDMKRAGELNMFSGVAA